MHQRPQILLGPSRNSEPRGGTFSIESFWALFAHTHGRKIARSGRSSPPHYHDTGMAASGEKAPRYRTFGHWPLEPVTQASAGRSLLVVPRAALMSPESVPQGSRCTACASNPRSDASYRAHLPSRVPIPAMPDSCAGQTPKRSLSMNLLLTYLRPRPCATLSLLRAGSTHVE